MKMKIWSKRHVFTCLMGGILRYRGSTSNEKRVIRRKAATLTLRDGEVFSKEPKKNSTGQKVNIYIARSVWHPCIDDFDQTGGI